ncbi:hypothetical protein WJU16_25230 [Chitinophaga pollutisoli]|uniref:Uncharacterized protein n=1 Tax=Chitinophaga pollutisoli TaxID=3133966 RepID=A0ABZ2YPY3_9BACT
MKRIVLSGVLALTSVIAFAQTQNAAPPPPGPAPASDHSTVLVGLKLENVISLVPPLDLMGAKFSSGHDYNEGEILEDLHGNHTSDFKVSSNRNFNVTIKSSAPNFSYTGPGMSNNVMPCGALKYNLFSNGTGGTNATPSAWNPLTVAAAPLITNGTYGKDKPFSLKFKADPGWDYTGGAYALGVILTATQL